jgi:TRAP-type C4-dicarboxylate transport system permease small subunit
MWVPKDRAERRADMRRLVLYAVATGAIGVPGLLWMADRIRAIDAPRSGEAPDYMGLILSLLVLAPVFALMLFYFLGAMWDVAMHRKRSRNLSYSTSSQEAQAWDLAEKIVYEQRYRDWMEGRRDSPP